MGEGPAGPPAALAPAISSLGSLCLCPVEPSWQELGITSQGLGHLPTRLIQGAGSGCILPSPSEGPCNGRPPRGAGALTPGGRSGRCPVPGWAAGLQRCRGCGEVEDAGLELWREPRLPRQSSAGAAGWGQADTRTVRGTVRGRARGWVCVWGVGHWGWWVGARKRLRARPLKTLPGTAEATVRASGYGTLGAGAMPVAAVSVTRCERTCLQVSVSVCEPWWKPSV